MKGKDVFTKNEAEMIKKLIEKKVVASKQIQKGIRDQIRSIGFYYSNYSTKKGYTVADFDELVKLGNVRIVN